jgi:hypothetical protein
MTARPWSKSLSGPRKSADALKLLPTKAKQKAHEEQMARLHDSGLGWVVGLVTRWSIPAKSPSR